MILCALVLGGTGVVSPASGEASYLPAVTRDGMVFPVARSNWFSVINLARDWHAPRMRLIDGRWQQVGVHEGNDIFAEPGTPVRSVTRGTVENLGWTFYSGWRAGIRDGDGRYWFYAHMRRFAPGLLEGARVEPGTPLGEVGNTGYGAEAGHSDEFTYHLHIGIEDPNEGWIDPYPLMNQLYKASVGRRGGAR